MDTLDSAVDVLVVGGGNAGLCAALSAAQEGRRVTLIDRADDRYRGGNSAFTAGAMRFAYDGVEQLQRVARDLSKDLADRTDFGTYSVEQFYEDLVETSGYRTDPDLAHKVAAESTDTLEWMASRGVRFLPIYGRQAYEVDGRFRFWGGLTVEAVGGGPGLVESLTRAAQEAGVAIHYGVRAVSLHRNAHGIAGVRAETAAGEQVDIASRAVILAAGGFQANPEWRTRYLGPGWDLAKVRGTRYNTGDGIRMAIEVGASSCGNWSGCHAVAWDANAPEFGDPRVGDSFQKHSYPLGVVVNARGERFLDEGENFRNYTYAKYGREILQQPGNVAWQLFDARVSGLLRDEYRIREVTKYEAESLEQLAKQIPQMDVDGLLRTVREYNAAIRPGGEFNPNVLDGCRTEGLSPDKTNWAQPLDQGPFLAFEVTCGITFTFGGLRIDPRARVLDDYGAAIPGLYAAGELVGGLFYFNYPGGSGLTAGSVLGRTAGREAAQHTAQDDQGESP
jgi:tricarballylate dehydrogenase